jgi:Tol biopolymer transport system component
MIRDSFVLVACTACMCVPSLAQTTIRVSVDSSGAQARGDSLLPSMTPDGRFVAFVGDAANLVAGDTNGCGDVFVHDMLTGATTLASVSSLGQQANAPCIFPSISADGRFVAFASIASTLVSGDTNAHVDVFVHDLLTGSTRLASHDSVGVPGNGDSYSPSISADGRYVAFASDANDLVPGDVNVASDVFVHDMLTGATTRVSVAFGAGLPDGPSRYPSISADGRLIAFESDATNLVPGGTVGTKVFVRDLQTETTIQASVSSAGVSANGVSLNPSISADGRFVAFWSYAFNLAPGDTNNTLDVFVHDLQNGETTRVSVDSNGLEANNTSAYPRLSADGRFVAFASLATNLVPGDTNGQQDVFVHDRLTGATTRVSVDSSGVQSNGNNYQSVISADGRYVAFTSSGNLVADDTNGVADVFVRDRGDASAFVALCFGDGSSGACPCGNAGASGHGCENSAATGGALLNGVGRASLSSDTVELQSSGEISSALSIVLQGSAFVAPTSFGDGLRCAGGALKRLYTLHAAGGSITAPHVGDPMISVRSSALGDAIPLGATRIYQVYYRDPNLAFCPGGFNVTHAIAIAWGA